MAKKQYFAVLDSETTIKDTIADLAIVICDREGRIYNQMAVMVAGHYGVHELFHDKNANDLWGYAGLEKRKKMYEEYLQSGKRMLASVNAINKWIQQAIGKYNPELTAFNLAFDANKCKNTEIDISGFTNSFCLWQAAVGNICQTKAYKQFVIENAGINNATQYRNQTIKTNAEMVASFIRGEYCEENHDALGDVVDFEIPILREVLRKKEWRKKITPYNWRDWQAKDHIVAK
jgi:hypothetical protein